MLKNGVNQREIEDLLKNLRTKFSNFFRLNVANLLTQDELEDGDWRISLRKWMFRFEVFYCWVNLIIGFYLVYQVIRYNDFGFLIKLAGILNFSTLILVCYNGWFFQRSLKNQFSGSYIKNVTPN